MTATKGKLEAYSSLASLTSFRASGDRADGEAECGDFGIRIDRQGTWYYLGSPIARKPMVKLFATVLNRKEDGSYWLTTPVENGRIEVEDVPFVAVEMTKAGEGRTQEVNFRTNLDAIVPLDDSHPMRVDINEQTGEPAPYIHVGKGLEARLARSVYYHLVDIGENGDGDNAGNFGVWSRGVFYVLGDVAVP